MFLIEFLRYILEFFYGLTNSYGFSIILLSLTVTIIMLPLFWIAEKIQLRERARKAKMQSSLDEIKDVNNKQEKYYYTQEIYRKNNYHPIYSLIGLLGLLIQVPFFLAAYWMLLDYSPLEGVSFGPIKDLFQPDGLVSLKGMSINLLPFVMTIVNVFASYLYAKNKDKSEQIQLVIIALVFLVLLYKLSSALVLYWTMNNVFALGKNWLISNYGPKYQPQFLEKNQSKQKVYLSTLWTKNSYLIFPLLFSVFPLLSIYYTNIGELSFSQIASLLFIIPLVTLILLVFAKSVFKNSDKVALFGFLLVAHFFSFGHLRELLRILNLGYIRPNLLGIIYIAGFSLACYLLFQTKINLKKASKIFSVFSVCLFSIAVFNIVLYNVTTKDKTLAISTIKDIQGKKNGAASNLNQEYPDIYYLVFDGYANSEVLRETHNFDNRSFETFLEDRGFFVAPDSRSNYVATSLSLTSTLNMDYINDLKDVLGVKTKSVSLLYQMLSDNNVIAYLKNKGYKTVHFSSGWDVTKTNQYADYNLPNRNGVDEFTTTFMQTTFLLPIINYFAANNYINNILYTFDNVPKLEDIKEPKFVFAHIVSPHPPYVFDENGNRLPSELKMNNSWSEIDKKYYLQQLKFVNNKIKVLVDSLLKKSDKPVIILQSDHGPAFLGNDWENPSPEFIKERTKILNAILLNNDGKEYLYPTMSSVNTFRIVFNHVFKDNFELLKDSTFFSSYENPYNFIDVTNTVDTN
ncbi:MAG: hypothetical protein Sapg2KO_20280 [Saprospiraceae bacterium]